MVDLDALRHDAADAADWVDDALRRGWSHSDVADVLDVVRDVAEFVRFAEVDGHEADLGTFYELTDAIRSEIGGWCACIHAEVSPENPCTCDGEA